MEKDTDSSSGMSSLSSFTPDHLVKLNSKLIQTYSNLAKATLLYLKGMMQYTANFMAPYGAAAEYFARTEAKRSDGGTPWGIAEAYTELLLFNMVLATKGSMASLGSMGQYHIRQIGEALIAMRNSLLGGKAEDMVGYSERQLRLMDIAVNAYPKAIRDIEPEYGFHFDNGGYEKIAETDRFELYQVLPYENVRKIRENGKPVLILPPYVLGANVLAFLPGEKRSYAHAFADTGTPTYIRIVKNIDTTPSVQLMTGEDDARDTAFFSERLMAIHGRPVTLNGYCQGGFMGVVDLLSGALDGLVDAMITCVAPMDGSRSKGLVEYIDHLPPRFRSLGYSLKTLPNGNQVVDGKVMSWVYKLKSMETEAPLVSFYRDLMMFDRGAGRMPMIGKIAAAVNHWITYDRTDLPVEITRLSHESYTKPVSKDGTLPFKLFGRSLNFKRIQEKGIKWLICIAERDDLVDEAASLAPLDHVDAEVAVFPKGHAAIATSWSVPTSECALHTHFGIKSSRYNGKSRGPVRFHLDIEKEQSRSGADEELATAMAG